MSEEIEKLEFEIEMDEAAVAEAMTRIMNNKLKLAELKKEKENGNVDMD